MVNNKNCKDVDDAHLTKEKVLHCFAYDEPFSVFRVLRNSDYEIRHSSFLAWLFDKDESHGFGNRFAVEFFKKAYAQNDSKDTKKFIHLDEGQIEGIKDVDWEERFNQNITVKTEVPTKSDRSKTKGSTSGDKTSDAPQQGKKRLGQKRIDILIEGEKFVCVIENKTGSAEHGNQCKDYKRYIEESEEYNNKNKYFIFLDIVEPKEWENTENNTSPYQGYSLMTYNDVHEILKTLLEDKDCDWDKSQSEVRTFISQYMNLISKDFGLKTLYDRVMEDETLLDSIINMSLEERKNLSPKQKAGLDRFNDYLRMVQAENDEIVREALEALIKEEYVEKMIDYHKGKAKKKDPYAYTIKLGDNEGKADAQLQVVNKYLQQIDVLAKNGRFSIDFYSGKNAPKSLKWLEQLKTGGLEERILDLTEGEEGKNWDIRLYYEIYTGAGKSIPIEFENIEEYKLVSREDKKHLFEFFSNKYSGTKPELYVGEKKKDVLIKDGRVNNNGPMEIFNTFFKERSEEAKQKIKEYFEPKEDAKKGIIENKALIFRWLLYMSYKLPMEITTREVLDDKSRSKEEVEELKRKNLIAQLIKVYYEQIKNGLNVFEKGLGDNFVKNFFQDLK